MQIDGVVLKYIQDLSKFDANDAVTSLTAIFYPLVVPKLNWYWYIWFHFAQVHFVYRLEIGPTCVLHSTVHCMKYGLLFIIFVSLGTITVGIFKI